MATISLGFENLNAEALEVEVEAFETAFEELTELYLGVETLTQEIHSTADKSTAIDNLNQLVEIVKEHGVQSGLAAMLGEQLTAFGIEGNLAEITSEELLSKLEVAQEGLGTKIKDTVVKIFKAVKDFLKKFFQSYVRVRKDIERRYKALDLKKVDWAAVGSEQVNSFSAEDADIVAEGIYEVLELLKVAMSVFSNDPEAKSVDDLLKEVSLKSLTVLANDPKSAKISKDGKTELKRSVGTLASKGLASEKPFVKVVTNSLDLYDKLNELMDRSTKLEKSILVREDGEVVIISVLVSTVNKLALKYYMELGVQAQTMLSIAEKNVKTDAQKQKLLK